MRSMKENRKRTVVTIIGIMLATALLMGVTCLFVSLRAGLIDAQKRMAGEYHYCFRGVKREKLSYFQQNPNVETIGLTAQLGCAVLGKNRHDYLFLDALYDDEAPSCMGMELKMGRMPQRDDEIVISSNLYQVASYDLKVGDQLRLLVGERFWGDEALSRDDWYLEGEELRGAEEKTYTIVGVFSYSILMAQEESSSPGYTAYTRMSADRLPESMDVYVKYNKAGLREHGKVTAGILGVSQELLDLYLTFPTLGVLEQWHRAEKTAQEVSFNEDLVTLLSLRFSGREGTIYYGCTAILLFLIVMIGIFCIRNSFSISLTEKVKLYGRLASVGTTGRQMRSIVFYEATYLGIVGIPLGILTGIFGVWVLLRFASGRTAALMKEVGFSFRFGVSWAAVFVAVLLAVITIYYSAFQSAWKASRITPIEAIRANHAVKRGKEKLKTPAWIKKCFGIGGSIAYKNMKRVKGKYRVVFWPIVLGCSAFIGLSTFMEIMQERSEASLRNIGCQIYGYFSDRNALETARSIEALEQVTRCQISRSGILYVDVEDFEALSLTDLGREKRDFFTTMVDGEEKLVLYLYTLNDAEYRKYCKKIGVSWKEAKDKAIIQAYQEFTLPEDGREVTKTVELAHFPSGMILKGKAHGSSIRYASLSQEEREEYMAQKPETTIEVLCQTLEKPLNPIEANKIWAFVSEEWMDANPEAEREGNVSIGVLCEDSDFVEQKILELDSKASVYNFDAVYRASEALLRMMMLGLYSFIGVISLICVTNIFNTITTNMELRAPEFAVLRSISMDDRAFHKMVWMEWFFCGGKALLVGICTGVLISYKFYDILKENASDRYQFPILGILVSAAVVFALLFWIMSYSMRRIGKKNIIETIRNENV